MIPGILSLNDFFLDQENFLESWNLWLESLTALIADVHLHQAVRKSWPGYPSDDRKLSPISRPCIHLDGHHAGSLSPSALSWNLFSLFSSCYPDIS